VAGLVPALKGQPGTVVAVHQVPECARLMLSYLIDRPVPERKSPSDFAGARWVLVPADGDALPGFQVKGATERYKLLMRPDDTWQRRGSSEHADY
jgi:hypothetical protein